MPVPGAFPLVKLGALAVRQVAKPLANAIKTRAKSHPFFRKYICMPPAQFYHWMEVNVKMRMLNLGKPREVPKLEENAAIELGADLLGETIIFLVAATTVTLEYMRQSRNAARVAAAEEARWENVESQIEKLTDVISKQNQAISILSEHLPNKSVKDKESKNILMNAIKEAQVKMGTVKPVENTSSGS